ncbi:hypothetical protein [Alteromonas gracilis]|uniref:hypothetical protein n=1 Tax=Alteromonas gracilis TaxID=1479524 RepID=UPI003734D5BD
MNRFLSLKWASLLALLIGGISVFILNKKASLQNDVQSAEVNKQQALLISQVVCDFLSKKDERRSITSLANGLSNTLSNELTGSGSKHEVSSCEHPINEHETALLSTLFAVLPLGSEHATLFNAFHIRENSVSELVKTINASLMGKFEVYYFDEQKQLLGFSVTEDNLRIYAAVNFSYDMHEMPLPLGFMASTKVKLWKSDSGEINEFVTQGSLSISAFSTAVIILD